MPQDLSFAIPFAAPVSEHLDRARERHLVWVRSRDLIRSAAGMEEYMSWDLPQAAARTYPHASADDMFMLMNWFSLAFLFDDQFDSGAAGHADRVASASREMIAIPFRPPGTPVDVVGPITLAWAEVWAWLRDGMSESWQNRFASSWARFLAAHAHEVRLSASGAILDLPQYLALRRITVGIHHSIDAAERSRGFEVPAQVQAHPVMRDMRATAADTIAFMNDIHSLEREERRGDPHNLVTVLRRQIGCSRQGAIDEAARMTADRLELYLRLESQLSDTCRQLRLGSAELTAVAMGVEGIRNWIRGNHDWALATGRYSAAKTGLAAMAERGGRGSVDDLLSPSTTMVAGMGAGMAVARG
jgi:hypothetical protein